MNGFLGTELDGPLSVPVEGAGEGSSEGSSRRKITTWLEDASSWGRHLFSLFSKKDSIFKDSNRSDIMILVGLVFQQQERLKI